MTHAAPHPAMLLQLSSAWGPFTVFFKPKFLCYLLNPSLTHVEVSFSVFLCLCHLFLELSEMLYRNLLLRLPPSLNQEILKAETHSHLSCCISPHQPSYAAWQFPNLSGWRSWGLTTHGFSISSGRWGSVPPPRCSHSRRLQGTWRERGKLNTGSEVPVLRHMDCHFSSYFTGQSKCHDHP